MNKRLLIYFISLIFMSFSISTVSFAEQRDSKNILKQGLLGAAVGAVSSSASGGKAGKGALVGAGTNVIGGALLDVLGGGGGGQQQSAPAPRRVRRPAYESQQYNYPPQRNSYTQQQPYYDQQYQQPPRRVRRVPKQQSSSGAKKLLKQGILGAAVGAVSAETSGGKAGKGALVGAGTNVLGGALLDILGGGGQSSEPEYEYPEEPVYQEEYYEEEYYDQPYQQQNATVNQQTGYETQPVRTKRRVIRQRY